MLPEIGIDLAADVDVVGVVVVVEDKDVGRVSSSFVLEAVDLPVPVNAERVVGEELKEAAVGADNSDSRAVW